jgi:hypothetical protein
MKRLVVLCVLAFACPAGAEDEVSAEQSECVALLQKSLDFAEDAIDGLRDLSKAKQMPCQDLEEIYVLQKQSNELALKAGAVCPHAQAQEQCDAACYERRLEPIKRLRDSACSR